MAEESIALRDEAGVEHLVTRDPDGSLRVSGTTLHVDTAPDGSLIIENGEPRLAWAVASGNKRWVFVDGEVFLLEVAPRVPPSRQRPAEHGPVLAPMPATVLSVAVSAGDAVRRGDILVVLEAMKMELPVRAGVDGHVDRVACHAGDMVQAGQELVRLR